MPDPAADASHSLDARPAEAFSLTDDRGNQLPVPQARRREQRLCEGVWVLPVTLADDLSLRLADGWQAAAQAMPESSLVQQGDIWECPVQLDPARPWPAGSLALVLMLWPHVSRQFRGADPASGAGAEFAARDANGAAAPGAPSGPVLDAILAALDQQGRPTGSLASGVIRLALV